MCVNLVQNFLCVSKLIICHQLKVSRFCLFLFIHTYRSIRNLPETEGDGICKAHVFLFEIFTWTMDALSWSGSFFSLFISSDFCPRDKAGLGYLVLGSLNFALMWLGFVLKTVLSGGVFPPRLQSVRWLPACQLPWTYGILGWVLCSWLVRFQNVVRWWTAFCRCLMYGLESRVLLLVLIAET